VTAEAVARLAREAKAAAETRRLVGEARAWRPTHAYRWGKRLPGRGGELCRLIRTGALCSALIAFADGWRVVVPRHALRRLPFREVEPPLDAGDAARERQQIGAVERRLLVAQREPPLDGGEPVLDARGALIEPPQQGQHQIVGRLAHKGRMP